MPAEWLCDSMAWIHWRHVRAQRLSIILRSPLIPCCRLAPAISQSSTNLGPWSLEFERMLCINLNAVPNNWAHCRRASDWEDMHYISMTKVVEGLIEILCYMNYQDCIDTSKFGWLSAIYLVPRASTPRSATHVSFNPQIEVWVLIDCNNTANFVLLRDHDEQLHDHWSAVYVGFRVRRSNEPWFASKDDKRAPQGSGDWSFAYRLSTFQTPYRYQSFKTARTDKFKQPLPRSSSTSVFHQQHIQHDQHVRQIGRCQRIWQ